MHSGWVGCDLRPFVPIMCLDLVILFYFIFAYGVPVHHTLKSLIQPKRQNQVRFETDVFRHISLCVCTTTAINSVSTMAHELCGFLTQATAAAILIWVYLCG